MMVVFVLLAVLAAIGVLALQRLARGRTLYIRVPGRSRRAPMDAGTRKQVGIAAIAAVLVLMLTRWPAAAVAAGVLSLMWPRIAGGNTAGRRGLAKVEAVAAWTESLRDAAGAASGLEQAIPSTLTSAPALLVRPLRQLTARLQGRVLLGEALGLFAHEVDDPSADMVVAALLLNSRQRSGGLGRILTELAKNSREELEMRRKVEHQRRAVRRESLLICGIVIGFVIIQTLTSTLFIRAYSTFTGQCVLAVVVVTFAFGLIRIRKLSEPDPQPRFLTATADLTDLTIGRGGQR